MAKKETTEIEIVSMSVYMCNLSFLGTGHYLWQGDEGVAPKRKRLGKQNFE
jgi:hypothetical protein